jgi:hypothetical protein
MAAEPNWLSKGRIKTRYAKHIEQNVPFQDFHSVVYRRLAASAGNNAGRSDQLLRNRPCTTVPGLADSSVSGPAGPTSMRG